VSLPGDLPGDPAPDRVLILAPTGRDAAIVQSRLLAADLPSEICADLDTLLAAISRGAGTAVIAQEALSPRSSEALLAALEAQEPWSDIPVLLLTEAAWQKRPRVHPSTAFFERANVTLLERPLPVQLFLSAVRSAVRARRRQYQMRDLNRDLERAVQLSDLFVSILGHDLRTPLGAVMLSAETIIRLSPDSRALRPASRILTAVDRMTRMIEQLLDYARVRQGRGIPLQPRATDLGEICRPVVQEIEDAHPQASLVVRAAGDLAGVWDPDRLAQVVSNLVGNAVQHGTPGCPVAIELDGANATLVRLRVHNAGSIPADAVPTLFEAFKRAALPAAEQTGRSGLGLGLFIAREIVRAHGGNLGVRSSDADGTTFEVTLPRQSPPNDLSISTAS
jgi:signal transduction histidine kinase